MTDPTNWPAVVMAGLLVMALLEVRDLILERDDATADAKYWLSYTCWLEGRAPQPESRRFTPAQAAQFVHDLTHGFPDEKDGPVSLHLHATNDQDAVRQLIAKAGGQVDG